MTRALALLLCLAASAWAQWDSGYDERAGGTVPSTSSTTLVPTPTTVTSSTTSSTIAGGATPCGNPTTGTPPGTVGWWANSRTASRTTCTVSTASAIDGARVYLGTLSTPFGLRVAALQVAANGTLTPLCERRVTAATPGAWNTIALTGCPTVPAGTVLTAGWVADSNSTLIGEWSGSDCLAATGSAGTNRWSTGGTSSQSFPAAWNPTSSDGCRSAVALLVRPIATTPTTSSTSSSSTTSTSSTTTSTRTCCKPSTEPLCPP